MVAVPWTLTATVPFWNVQFCWAHGRSLKNSCRVCHPCMCMHICAYVFVCDVCMYACMYRSARDPRPLEVSIRYDVRKCMHVHVQACMCMNERTDVHKPLVAAIYQNLQFYVHACWDIRAYVHTQAGKIMQISCETNEIERTCLHACKCVCIDICMCVCVCVCMYVRWRVLE
jgi:hypothetical protein